MTSRVGNTLVNRLLFHYGSLAECQRLIRHFADSVALSHTLAEAEALVSQAAQDWGEGIGQFRDLLYFFQTETRAALLAVERREFESSFTSC